MSKARIQFDPNIRTKTGGSYSSIEFVEGPIQVNDWVEVYEPEGGLTAMAHVSRITDKLVYFMVDWDTLEVTDTPDE